MMLWWLTSTPFGRPVVPDEKLTVAVVVVASCSESTGKLYASPSAADGRKLLQSLQSWMGGLGSSEKRKTRAAGRRAPFAAAVAVWASDGWTRIN